MNDARQVGCEADDGLLIVHPESETCEVCAPFDEDSAIMVCGHEGRFWSSEWKACVACAAPVPAFDADGESIIYDTGIRFPALPSAPSTNLPAKHPLGEP